MSAHRGQTQVEARRCLAHTLLLPSQVSNRDSDKEDEDQESDQEEWELDEDDFNPYDCNFDVEAGAHVSHEDLVSSFAHPPKVPETTKPGMRSESLIVDKDVVAGRLVHLQKRRIILYTVNFNPSRDAFKIWVYRELGEKLQIKIEQIKVVTRFTFLVVVSKSEDQKRILMEKFLKLNGMMVLAIP